MKFTDRQKHFLHEAIHTKLIQAESMVRYLEREMNKENSIEIDMHLIVFIKLIYIK